MNLEVLAWAPDKKIWEQAITTTIVPWSGEPLAKYAYDMEGVQIMPPQLVYHAGLNVAELGEIVKTPAVYAPPPPGEMVGEILEPAVVVEGHHVDLRFHEPLADALVEGLPQVGPPDPVTGMPTPLSLWERTHILELFPEAAWDDSTGEHVPPGYMGAKNLKLFDPADVKSRSHGWA